MATNLIKEGDQVVFMRHGSSRVFQIRKNRQVYFEKNKFHVEELIGQPYGTTYEIQMGKLVKVDHGSKSEPTVDANVSEPTGDNRNLHDLDSNQKMSRDDIMDLKEKGLTGEEIIGELIEHSETFQQKTEFSKAKYLKKKKKRHILSFTVLRPSPRLVMDIFSKDPGKICNLRPDTLSQLLNYSNVMHGSRVVVVETCHGLVVSSVLQRLGGAGKLIQLIPNSSTCVNRKVVEYFTFTKEEMENVYTFPMDEFPSLKNVTDENDAEEETTAGDKEVQPSTDATMDEADDKEMGEKSQSDEQGLKMETGDDGNEADVKPKGEDVGSNGETDVPEQEVDGEGAGDMDACKEEGDKEGTKKPEWVSYRLQQRVAREARQKEAAKILASGKIDSLIIACKYNPFDIVKSMLDYLPASKPVVVFCQFMDPLVTIYSYIKDNRRGLQVQLSETWLRDYQVLPQRTHPMINMSGTGGYLLTFTTCDPS